MAAASPERPARPGAGSRSAARLAAVQALYQMELSGAGAEAVIAEFTGKAPLAGGAGEPDLAALAELPPPDPGLFGALVRGVSAHRARLDEIIAGALTADWPIGRLELLLRIILEAGVYEITERADVPPRVAISEYLNVAHAFYEGRETGLVNGVLDAVARAVRAGEIAGPRG